MAISISGIHNEKGIMSGNPASFTTSSVSYSAGDLLVAVLSTTDNQSGNLSTDASFNGGSLTWTKRLNRQSNVGGWYEVMEVWTAEPSSGGSATLTRTNASGAAVNSGWAIQVFKVNGYKTSGWLGTSKMENAPTNGAYTLTLSASPESTSIVLAGRNLADTLGVESFADPGTGWTELYDSGEGHDTWNDIQTMWRTNSTSTSVVWDDIDTANNGQITQMSAFALEIYEQPQSEKMMFIVMQ